MRGQPDRKWHIWQRWRDTAHSGITVSDPGINNSNTQTLSNHFPHRKVAGALTSDRGVRDRHSETLQCGYEFLRWTGCNQINIGPISLSLDHASARSIVLRSKKSGPRIGKPFGNQIGLFRAKIAHRDIGLAPHQVAGLIPVVGGSSVLRYAYVLTIWPGCVSVTAVATLVTQP